MATEGRFEYKGWSALVFNATGYAYMATARKEGQIQLYVDRIRGTGAKARAAEAIKQKIDERETK